MKQRAIATLIAMALYLFRSFDRRSVTQSPSKRQESEPGNRGFTPVNRPPIEILPPESLLQGFTSIKTSFTLTNTYQLTDPLRVESICSKPSGSYDHFAVSISTQPQTKSLYSNWTCCLIALLPVYSAESQTARITAFNLFGPVFPEIQPLNLLPEITNPAPRRAHRRSTFILQPP